MNNIKLNSLILVMYIYFTSLGLLLAPLINPFYVNNILLLCLILVAIFINKITMNLKLLFSYVFLIIFISLNLIFVSYKDYVLADGINLLFYGFVPLFLILQKLITFTYVKFYWIKLAKFTTWLLPIYYLYRQNGYISYFDIGFLAHLNILIIVYELISKKEKNFMYLLTNFIILGVLGSRLVLASSIITSIWTLIIFANKKRLSFYFYTCICTIIGLVIFQNLLLILNYLNVIIGKFGINSRNLSLLIAQLNGSYDTSIIVSGREEIYPVVLSYLNQHGILPSGFGVTRYITRGDYYHSHNLILEILLIFGFVGTILLFLALLYKLFLLSKSQKSDNETYTLRNLFLVLWISFLVRSFMGTHFIKDPIFLVCLGIIFSIDKKSYYNNVIFKKN